MIIKIRHKQTGMQILLQYAKIQHWMSLPKDKRGEFSMNDVKTIKQYVTAK